MWGPKPKSKSSSSSSLCRQTQAILDEIIIKRNMSKRAIEDLHQSVRCGGSEWVCNLNTGASNRRQTTKRNSSVEVPRFGRPAVVTRLPQARLSGKKLHHEIIRDTPPEREQFHGAPLGPDRDVEKARLSQVFEFGRDAAKHLQEQRQHLQQAGAKQREEASADPERVREEMISQILEEMAVREAWLEEMKTLHADGRYRKQVKAEIASRMSELRKLGVDVSAGRPQNAPARLIA